MTAKYPVLMNLQLDATLHQPGATVDLTEEAAQELIALGVLGQVIVEPPAPKGDKPSK